MPPREPALADPERGRGLRIGRWQTLAPGATPAAQSIPTNRTGTVHGSRRRKD